MNTKLNALLGVTFLVTALALKAAEPVKAKPCSPEFERMKSLVGSWKGKVDIGEGPVEMTVQYRLIAGGTVLEERVFSGTPNEMVTMYYDKNGKLALTHYCMLGNRPAMFLKSAEGKTLTFEFDESCGIDCAKETHMHSLALRFDDADTITSTCIAMADGKKCDGHETKLVRVKS